MDEHTVLLALCAEPAAVVDRAGHVQATNERLQREAGPEPVPATLDELLGRFDGGVVARDAFRAAVADAVRAGAPLRRYAPSADPDADDVEVLVLPEGHGADGASLVVLRLPGRRTRDEALARRHDRLALLGQLLAEAAHELNNVLTTVIGWSHLLAHPRGGASPGELVGNARQVETAALKAQRIVADLMGIARGQEEEAAANAAASAREVARMMAGECDRRSIRMVVEVPDDLEARIRRYRLTQVLLNLVRNAVQALRHGGCVRIAGARDGAWIVLRVEDDGPGMDAATLARAFQPYFTTRRADGAGEEAGTGIGLPLSRKIVEQEAGGSIRLESAPGRGTTVELRLPHSQLSELRSSGIRHAPPAAAPDGFSLLVVERNVEVGTLVAEAVRRSWDVVPVVVPGMESATQALRARPFSVCLLDADADPDGPAAAIGRLAALRADLAVLLASSGDSWAGIGAAGAARVAGEIRKPYSVPELLIKLAAAARHGTRAPA